MDATRKGSIWMFVCSVSISLENQNAETQIRLFTFGSCNSKSSSIFSAPLKSESMFLSVKNNIVEGGRNPPSLEYDYYRHSCPQSEKIVRAMVRNLYKVQSNVASALLRLVFHNFFVEGSDASVLLDPSEEIDAEKESPPQETLKGFNIIERIKSVLEEACPGDFSCADILVLAATEGAVLAGDGEAFYPLLTGRRDSALSFREITTIQLPSPHENLSKTIAAFASRGFDEQESVSLLGARCTGMIHCKFFENCLDNFRGTNKPDSSLNPNFLNLMRSRCNTSHISSPSFSISPPASPPSFNGSLEESGMEMNYEGGSSDFGWIYYRSLLQGRGLLFADQQLMAGEGTAYWVRASLFHRDFALGMMKLLSLRVLTAPVGQVRTSCSTVA